MTVGTSSIRVGVSTPWDLWELSPDEQRSRLGDIADAGIDHVFTADHVSFIDGSGMDGLVALAAMSGIEPRLGLHVGVLLLALRHPMVAARQIATLAQAAPGRLTVGVGVGGEDRHEIEVCGVDPATRGRRTDVSLDVVRRLLDGEIVDADNDFFSIADASIRPIPKRQVPFVVGGRSDAAIERAGRLGDGWLAAWCSGRRFAEGCRRAEEIGGDRRVEWQHGLQVWVGVGRDAGDARSHVANGMERFYKLPFSAFERYTPMGSAEQIADFLVPYVDAGATMLNLTPCGVDRDVELTTIAEVKRLLVE
ncbi:MAG: LLM class flavin-dependent oxidoreductase [Ilumatobacter sp.]|uniref:LLM class flavin-dependent oxidoreductase n=1 Tax=Ilumatobacter sp. TaxID=1967498 RepID=UPI003918E3BD